MDLQLEGRHVLVTGASRGIGLACVLAFLAEGAKVSGVSRSAQSLAEGAKRLPPGARFAPYPADLQSAEDARRMVEQVELEQGSVDILVNCAGAARRTPFHELDATAWHAAMQAKYFSYIHVIDPLVKRMGERRQGVIINIAGAGGKLASTTHLAGGAANAALMLAGNGLATAYAPLGVRVNTINPGPVRTDRLLAHEDVMRRAAEAQGLPPPAPTGANLPLGRPAEPGEIADVAVFLASARASYVTGAVIALDGAAIPTVL